MYSFPWPASPPRKASGGIDQNVTPVYEFSDLPSVHIFPFVTLFQEVSPHSLWLAVVATFDLDHCNHHCCIFDGEMNLDL